MFDKLKYSFDEENIEAVRKHKLSCNEGEKIYGLVNVGPASCDIKVSEESRKICVDSLLK